MYVIYNYMNFYIENEVQHNYYYYISNIQTDLKYSYIYEYIQNN